MQNIYFSKTPPGGCFLFMVISFLKLNCDLGRHPQMICKTILKMVVNATSLQNFICCVWTSYMVYIQLLALQEWKLEIENYESEYLSKSREKFRGKEWLRYLRSLFTLIRNNYFDSCIFYRSCNSERVA